MTVSAEVLVADAVARFLKKRAIARAASAQYYQKNRKVQIARQIAWHQANKERVNARRRALRALKRARG